MLSCLPPSTIVISFVLSNNLVRRLSSQLHRECCLLKVTQPNSLTPENRGSLGSLILYQTFLTWAWPMQKKRKKKLSPPCPMTGWVTEIVCWHHSGSRNLHLQLDECYFYSFKMSSHKQTQNTFGTKQTLAIKAVRFIFSSRPDAIKE